MPFDGEKSVNIPINSESFHNDDSFVGRVPLTSLHNLTDSPDVSQKTFLTEIRKLNSKINELQNCCDDYENEKQELLQTGVEREKKISALEEKCRFKEKELSELRHFNHELEKFRTKNENMKIEIERLVEALKVAQERKKSIVVLEKENDEFAAQNRAFKIKIRALEAEVLESRNTQSWKLQCEQAKSALEKAEKTLYEFVRDSERAKEASEVEALGLRSNLFPPATWAQMTRSKCTCTCHHTQQPSLASTSGWSPQSTPELCASNKDYNSPISVKPETTQNMGDISVMDVSLWRDARIGSTPSEVSGECLGEVMAYDAKIRELETQSTKLQEEVDHLRKELSQLSSDNENLNDTLLNISLERKALITDLEEKRLALEEVNLKVNTLSEQLVDTSSRLSTVQIESNNLKSTLSSLTQELNITTTEKSHLSEKLSSMENEMACLIEKEKKMEEAKALLETDLSIAKAGSKEMVASLEAQVVDLKHKLTEAQTKLDSTVVSHVQLSEQLVSLEKDRVAKSDHELLLSQQLLSNKEEVVNLTSVLKQLNVELSEKEDLLEHLKNERVVLTETREAAYKELSATVSDLSQARVDIIRLSNELSCALENNRQIEHLESSLGARESSIMTLNQVLSDKECELSRLSEEKSKLVTNLYSLQADLQSKSSACSLLIAERDKAKTDLLKCQQDLSFEKEQSTKLHDTVVAFEADLKKLTETNHNLSGKCDAVNSELSICQQQLVASHEELGNLTTKNHHQLYKNTKLSEELGCLRQELSKQTACIAEMHCKEVDLSGELSQLRSKADKYEAKIAQLLDSNYSLESTVQAKSDMLSDIEHQLVELRLQMTKATSTNEELATSNSRLSEEVASLEAKKLNLESRLEGARERFAALVGAQTQEEANLMLETRMKRVRADLLAAEQRAADAQQATSLAALHRQAAENECARLTRFIEALERRLDSTTTDRLACEERLTAETVRCRQLEGALHEKEAIISGLQHHLDQMEYQQKIAQENESSVYRQYAKSRVVYEEAEKRLALLQSATSVFLDKKRSICSLDQSSNTLPNPKHGLSLLLAGDSQELHSMRRHSDTLVACSSPVTTVPDRVLPVKDRQPNLRQERGSKGEGDTEHPHSNIPSFQQNIYREPRRSPLFGLGFRRSNRDMASRTQMMTDMESSRSPMRQEPFPEDNCRLSSAEAGATPSAQLHVIRNEDLLSCTPVNVQETAVLEDGSWSEVEALALRNCQKSPLFNPIKASPWIFSTTETVEQPRCLSSTSVRTDTSCTSDPVSELSNWPPYGNCAAPVSPRALRGDQTFPVIPEQESHFRRLRRLLLAPAAEEMEIDDILTCALEMKPIPLADSLKRLATKRGADSPNKVVLINFSSVSSDRSVEETPLVNVGRVGVAEEKFNASGLQISNSNATFRVKNPSELLRQQWEESNLNALSPEAPLEQTIIDARISEPKIDRLSTASSDRPSSTAARGYCTWGASVLRPTAPKLARYHSAVEVSAPGGYDLSFQSTTKVSAHSSTNLSIIRNASTSRSHPAPPPSFRRFREKFVKGCKHTADVNVTPSSSHQKNIRGENKVDAKQASSTRDSSKSSTKSKKSSKLSLSNVFKTRTK